MNAATAGKKRLVLRLIKKVDMFFIRSCLIVVYLIYIIISTVKYMLLFVNYNLYINN